MQIGLNPSSKYLNSSEKLPSTEWGQDQEFKFLSEQSHSFVRDTSNCSSEVVAGDSMVGNTILPKEIVVVNEEGIHILDSEVSAVIITGFIILLELGYELWTDSVKSDFKINASASPSTENQ